MARNGKFLFGAILGALFGLAFAPKKGSELRKEVKSEIDKGGYGEKTLKKIAKHIGEDLVVTSKEVYNDPNVQKQIKKGKKEAMKMAEEAKGIIKESGEQWVKVAREKVEEQKKHFEKEGAKAVDTLKKKASSTAKQIKKEIKPATATKKSKKK